MSKTITVKAAKTALQNLRQLTPASPKLDDDQEMTVKEAVFFMAPDLIRMSKRGFTSKELADGLAGEGVSVKPGTLNRYLNEYAEKDLEKSKASLGTGEKEPVPGIGSAETARAEPGPENPKSASKNHKPGGQTAGGKSDSPPDDQRRPSSDINRE